MPALEQHLGQGQGLQVVFPGIDQLALIEQAIGVFVVRFQCCMACLLGSLGSDAAGGEFFRVQQCFELVAGQVGVLQRHVDHRAPLLVGGLGDFGGLEVTDDRVQRGDQDRVARQRFLELASLTLKLAMALSASSG
jgi:hypothetical protein